MSITLNVEPASELVENKHDKVQLWEGGPYWATTNIGAEKPEDSGYYFWWGDTVGYKRENDKWVASDGSNLDFSFSSVNTPTYNKSISTLQSEGWITSENVLVLKYDAANIHWGNGWRMPTEDELRALNDTCDWTWTTLNGVNGYIVKGRGTYASNSIFLPAAGYGGDTSLRSVGSYGDYWSSVSGSDGQNAKYLNFYSRNLGVGSAPRGFGLSVRPVLGCTIYTVTFDANGGEEGTTSSYADGSTLGSLPTPTREGYTLAGWFTAAEGGEQVDVSTVVNDNVTYYAHWEQITDTHDKVQLWEGGPYWATTNIGAEKSEDYGYYFLWGDTVGYKRENDKWVASDGSNSNFSFSDSNTPTYNKSETILLSEGWITSDGVLAPEHDAATVHWGNGWRMPTKDELSSLRNNCDWTWTTQNGVNGYIVKGRGAYASNSIFLPATGDGRDTSLNNVGSIGYYWSSVPYSDDYNAWLLYFSSSYRSTDDFRRHYGRPVRPVLEFTK